MSNTERYPTRTLPLLTLLLVAYAIAVAWTLPGKYPWHDEITTLRNTRESFSHLIGTYYTHKAYILSAKICTTLLGESWTTLRLPAILMGGLTLLAVYGLGSTLFRRSVGLASAAYLLVHPSFLFYSTDARGYQGACLFSVLAAAFLWRGLSKVKILDCILAAVCLFLGLMMQPTAALTYPGMILVAFVLIVQTFRDKTEGRRSEKKRLAWLLAISILLGLVLIGPRVWDYLRWDTLLIPTRFASEPGGADVAGGGPLRTLEGWRVHFAPFISAEHHTGGMVTLGWFLILASILFSWKKKCLQTTLLLLCLLAPFLFFVLYNPPFLVQRYLYCALPFAVLLTVKGAFSIGESIGHLFRSPKRRWVRRGIEGGFLAILFFSCWGPFRAEIAYSEYGATWMVPIASLAEEDFMEDRTLILIDEKPLWRDQLAMLGVPEDRLEFHPPSVEGGHEELLENLDRRDWVVLKAYSQEMPLQQRLRELGWIELQVEQGKFFLSASEFDSNDPENSTYLKAVEYLDENFNLDFRFHYSVSRFLEGKGKQELAAPYETRAMEGMASMNRWDYPRTFGAYTSALGDHALEQDRPLEAAKTYSRAFGEPQSRPYEYVSFVDKVPPDARNRVVQSWGFDPDGFAHGFIDALERSDGLAEDYKAYWTFKGAQVLDQNGRLDEAWPLYEYSIDHGDSLGRAAQRLFKFYVSAEDYLDAARTYLRTFGHPSTPYKNYADLFEALPEDRWNSIVGLEEFQPDAYVEGFVESLSRDTELNDNEKRFWSNRIGEILLSVGLSEQGEKLRSAFQRAESPQEETAE